MIAVKYSKEFYEKVQRANKLSDYYTEFEDTLTKKDAVALIEIFRNGIRDGSFGLQPLKDATVRRKIKEGKEKPGIPLYGDGDNEPNSYINTFRIRKLKNGYRVFASWAKHHESKLTLRQLFEIHELGTLIRMSNGTIIRIPPRPAFAKAYRQFLRSRKQSAKEFNKAKSKYIRTGDDSDLKKLTSKEGLDKYDET